MKQEKMYRLLVVEDEKFLRRMYRKELGGEGYHITPVAGGREALDALQGSSFDLIILDMRMPGMDGLEVLEQIIGGKRGIPVIIHSAHPGYKENFITWGAEAFVVKSTDLAELKSTIRQVLAGRENDTEKTDTAPSR
jgi:CheY-like chemotaxis protein